MSLTLPTSKAIVASRLNLTPEHFSRILHELQAKGLIQRRRREIRILDIAKLRASRRTQRPEEADSVAADRWLVGLVSGGAGDLVPDVVLAPTGLTSECA